VHHGTATVAVRCAISFHIGRSRPLVLRTGWRTRHCPVHTRQSSVPNRPLVRAMRRPLIAQPTVGRKRRWLTGQSGAPPGSLVNYSRGTFSISRERWVRRQRLGRGHWRLTGQSGAPLGCPLIFSQVARPVPKSGQFTAGSAWSTGHCPVHHRTVRCARLVLVLADHSHSFFNLFLLFSWHCF
jgi:hypothetical protein